MLQLLIAFALFQQPATFGLAWDPNTETDLAGYRVYIGTVSGSYGPAVADLPSPPVVDGAVTWYPPSPLAPGTYFCVVTAYNTSGVESGFSNEVTLTLPAIPNPLTGLTPFP